MGGGESGKCWTKCVGGKCCPLLSRRGGGGGNCKRSANPFEGGDEGFAVGSEGSFGELDVGTGMSVSPGAAPCHGRSLLMWKDLLPRNMESGMSTR